MLKGDVARSGDGSNCMAIGSGGLLEVAVAAVGRVVVCMQFLSFYLGWSLCFGEACLRRCL